MDEMSFSDWMAERARERVGVEGSREIEEDANFLFAVLGDLVIELAFQSVITMFMDAGEDGIDVVRLATSSYLCGMQTYRQWLILERGVDNLLELEGRNEAS